MNSAPLVSVVIPFYNNSQWLSEALQSVKKQSYSAIEVIVVNDGSIEDISDLENEYPTFQFYKTPNFGAGAARNYGINKINGDYICFLDSDDLWEEQKIEKQLNFMISNIIVWSHTDYNSFVDHKPDQTKLVKTELAGNILPKMLITNKIATPCIMIKAEVLKNNNFLRFGENISVGEDSFLWINLAENYPLGYLPESLTKVRLRGTNAAFDAKRQLESKAMLASYVHKNRKWFSNSTDYFFVNIGFSLAKKLYNMLNILISDKENQKSYSSTIYKFFYIFPYIYLKAIAKILKV